MNYYLVRVSTLVLLLGVGSFACYKFIFNQNKKKKKRPFEQFVGFEEPSGLAVKECGYKQDSFTNQLNKSNIVVDQRKKLIFTSTPYHGGRNGHQDIYTPSYIGSSVCSEMVGNELLDSIDLTELTAMNTVMTTPTTSLIGDGTVAKLDLLLMQIEDIKRSVVEIDAELFDVGGVTNKFDTKIYSIAPDCLTPSLSVDSFMSDRMCDANMDHALLNNTIDAQTPSLEWDVNDMNGMNSDLSALSLADLSDTCYDTRSNLNSTSHSSSCSSSDSTQSSHQRTSTTIEDASMYERSTNLSLDLSSPTSTSSSTSLSASLSTSSSTSGLFSDLNSPEEILLKKPKKLQKLIEEAQSLGILNELIEVLEKEDINSNDDKLEHDKQSKRDSAYSEN